MDARELRTLGLRLLSLSVFRAALGSEALGTLSDILLGSAAEARAAELAGRFVYSLAPWDYSLSEHIRQLIYEDDNIVIVNHAASRPVSEAARKNCEEELALFSRLTALRPEELFAGLSSCGFPRFENEYTDFGAVYAQRLANVRRTGYGVFACTRMLRLEGGELMPVAFADDIRLDSFVGYEAPRGRVAANVKALLEGRPAANMLLFGDAGTGKSSTVKACVNEFADEGLRLIELRKDQLLELPLLMGRLAGNPLKFIIFVDDLSFEAGDGDFGTLKAVLEGGASARAKNVLICATSNRRHMVRERFSDRNGPDEVHINDAVQELISLSDRFAETVYFEKPDKALYLGIAQTLAKRAGIAMPEDEFGRRAEAFALKKGSRSPRAAEQFVESLM